MIILSSLLCMFGIQYAVASDTVEQGTNADNIQFSDEQYMHDTMDELAQTRARVDELLIPKQTSQNLWTDDTLISNGESVQAVIMMPHQENHPRTFKPEQFNKKAGPKSAGASLGEQSYYGETVYIINNFLSGGGDNVSATDEKYNGGAIKSAKVKSGAKCPFEDTSACEVWFRKPIVSETVAPRSYNLRPAVMEKISKAIEKNPNISANAKVMKPLLERYQVLMRASQSCCTGGLTHRMRKAGATNDLIYKFLADDVNSYGFGSRCFAMDDEEIMSYDTKYRATASTVADVRDACICKSKETLTALLAPFDQLYQKYPDFANADFEYSHVDGLGRAYTDSVNLDVQNVLNQLDVCP